MNILVVGGAGYIGSHMCRHLAEAGHRPYVLDDLSTGHRQAVKWGVLVEAGLEERDVVAGVLRTNHIDAVMHFAASSAVAESLRDPYRYYANNVCATLSLLQAMRSTGVDRFVFSSTAAIFGNAGSMALDERRSREPINPYGNSKLAVELMLEDAARAYGLHAVTLRYFNAAGACPYARIGEARRNETHLIPNILRLAAGEPREIRIYGSDYATRDGTCVRDYVHVCDLADAHLAALEYCAAQPGFHRFNLGSETGCTVLEVLAVAEAVTGRPLPAPRAPRRPGDPAVLVADSRLARTTLGWRPRYSNISRIIADAWAWHRDPAY